MIEIIGITILSVFVFAACVLRIVRILCVKG